MKKTGLPFKKIVFVPSIEKKETNFYKDQERATRQFRQKKSTFLDLKPYLFKRNSENSSRLTSRNEAHFQNE